VFSQGGKNLELAGSDIHDWNITFAETGMRSNIGMRLKAVEKYVRDEEVFLANYCDGLTDLHFPTYLDYALEQDRVATFVTMKPNLSYHVVETGSDGLVTGIKELSRTGIRINGGMFVLKQDIFRHMKDGEELVFEPFQRLIERKQLSSYAYNGFFATMDTFKDKQQLDDLYESGQPPWEIWKKPIGEAKKPSSRGSGGAAKRTVKLAGK
jgi:glucose-1-phosphate cytidylyltransferase